MVHSELLPDINASAIDRVSAGGKRKDPKIPCIAWQKRYDDDYPSIPVWRILATPSGTKPVTGYVLNPPPDELESDLSTDYWNKVSEILSLLPERIVAVQSKGSGVVWLGIEKIDAVPEDFVAAMSRGLDQLISLNVEIGKLRLETRSDR